MTTQNGFPPERRFPIFLSEDAEITEQLDIRKALDRAAISSRILKASILAVTATAIAIAILLGDPVALLTDITASWVDKSAHQPGTEPSASTIPSVAGTQDLPPATKDASTRDETAAALEPVDQSQTEIAQPSTDDLRKQFEAWAAERDTRAQVEPVQPVQDAPAQVVQQNAPVKVIQDTPVQAVHDAQAQVRPVKKHRRVRSVHNARAEIRSSRNPRAQVREEQNARVQAPPVPDARAPDQPGQNVQAPSFLQNFGWRN